MPSVNYNLESFVSIEELETEQGPKEGILSLHEQWGELVIVNVRVHISMG